MFLPCPLLSNSHHDRVNSPLTFRVIQCQHCFPLHPYIGINTQPWPFYHLLTETSKPFLSFNSSRCLGADMIWLLTSAVHWIYPRKHNRQDVIGNTITVFIGRDPASSKKLELCVSYWYCLPFSTLFSLEYCISFFGRFTGCTLWLNLILGTTSVLNLNGFIWTYFLSLSSFTCTKSLWSMSFKKDGVPPSLSG